MNGRAMVLVLLAASGCSREEEIAVYDVPRRGAPPAEAVFGVIVPRESEVWFFKARGPAARVERARPSIEAWLRTARWGGDGVRWTLPDGWREERGGEMRFATVTLPDALEVTVTALPPSSGDLLANVNRWRQQLGLEPTRDVPATTIEIDGAKGTVVVIGAGDAAPAPPRGALAYETPPGWQDRGASGLRAASFAVQDGAARAEVTVIPLGREAADVRANVDRWREQLGLPPAGAGEAATTLDVNGVAAPYVDLQGGRRMLAVMVERGDRVWFIKMLGDVALVGREKPAFESFVRSVRLP